MKAPQQKAGSPQQHGHGLEWLSRVGQWIGEHRSLVLIAALAGMALIFFIHGYLGRARTEWVETWQELGMVQEVRAPADAKDPVVSRARLVEAQCRSILERHWKTEATPWVLLQLAAAQQAAGDFGAALGTFERLRTEYPQHYATDLSAEGYAAALGDSGQFEQAAQEYEKLAERAGPGSRHQLDAGLSLELAGNRDAAIAAYQKLVAAAAEASPGLTERAQWRLQGLTAAPEWLLPPPPQAPRPDTEVVIELPYSPLEETTLLPGAETDLMGAIPPDRPDVDGVEAETPDM